MAYDIDEDILYIFTDWASRPWLNKKPKRSWGMWVFFVYIDKNFQEVHEDMSDYIAYLWATNNDMELQAAINGLDIISNGYDITPLKKIMIITDSHFVCYNRKNAYYGNRDRTKRQTKFNDPVIHKPLRRKFAKLIYEIKSKHFKPFEMDRVKWHDDDENNKRADKAAVKWAQSASKVKGSNTTVRKQFFKSAKRYKGPDKTCFIPHQDSEIYIHPYMFRYLENRWFRYNYEVVSRESEYFMQKGHLFHKDTALSAEFIYLVRLANDGSHRIIEVISKYSKESIRNRIIEVVWESDLFI